MKVEKCEPKIELPLQQQQQQQLNISLLTFWDGDIKKVFGQT